MFSLIWNMTAAFWKIVFWIIVAPIIVLFGVADKVTKERKISRHRR